MVSHVLRSLNDIGLPSATQASILRLPKSGLMAKVEATRIAAVVKVVRILKVLFFNNYNK